MAKAKKVEQEIPKTDLVIADQIQPAVLFGGEHETLETLLQKIKTEVSSIVPDVSTAKGRKAITANVSRVTKSKTLLDKVGKEYNAAQKELLKAFDARRKHAFDFLEDLQKEVRKPLTEWEDKDKARIAKCESVVNAFIKASEDSDNWMNYTLEELNDLLKTVEEVSITKRLAEFEDEAAQAKANAVKNINTAIQNRTKYDEDQAELEKLRAAAAEQDRINFEANERMEKEKAIREAEIKANTEKEAAIKAAEQEKEDAIKRAEDAEKQAAIDAEEAEKQKQIDIEAAAQAERDRIEQERLKAEREAAEREADTKHRGKINRAAVKAFVDASKAYDSGENVLAEGQAKLIIKVIANNKVPNVKISY